MDGLNQPQQELSAKAIDMPVGSVEDLTHL